MSQCLKCNEFFFKFLVFKSKSYKIFVGHGWLVVFMIPSKVKMIYACGWINLNLWTAWLTLSLTQKSKALIRCNAKIVSVKLFFNWSLWIACFENPDASLSALGLYDAIIIDSSIIYKIFSLAPRLDFFPHNFFSLILFWEISRQSRLKWLCKLPRSL